MSGAIPKIITDNLWINLSDRRAVLQVSGSDSLSFLQSIITQDVHKLSEPQALLSAMLSPQGKFLFDFFMLKTEGNKIWLEGELHRVGELKKALSRYKLRSDVSLEILDNMNVAAIIGELDDELLQMVGINNSDIKNDGTAIYFDPRDKNMGLRIIGDKKSIEEMQIRLNLEHGTENKYDYNRILLRLAEGSRDAIIDKTILLENHYDTMNGVSFTKGCYVGQEITARSHHIGNLRKKLMTIYSTNADDDLPASLTPIMAGDLPIGEIRSVMGNIALAMIRNDRLEKAQAKGDIIVADGVIISYNT